MSAGFSAGSVTLPEVSAAAVTGGFIENLWNRDYDAVDRWIETLAGGAANTVVSDSIRMNTGAVGVGDSSTLELNQPIRAQSNGIATDTAVFQRITIEWCNSINTAGLVNVDETSTYTGLIGTTGDDRTGNELLGIVCDSSMWKAVVKTGGGAETLSTVSANANSITRFKIVVGEDYYEVWIGNQLALSGTTSPSVNYLTFHIKNNAAAAAYYQVKQVRVYFE